MNDEKLSTSSISDAQQRLAQFSQTTFTDLQHDFHELNHDIPKDSPLENFRHEYAKLFGILQKSMTNQARYIEKCRVLESEIVGNEKKVRTVSKLAEEDAKSIANLNDERDKKQSILNESKENLKSAMEENAKVNSEIIGYENELEQCVADERGQKDFLKQLKNRRNELKKEHDELNAQIPLYEENNKQTSEKLEQKDKEIEESIAELKRIEELFANMKLEEQKERQALLNLERDRDATKVRLAEAKQRLKERQNEVLKKQEDSRVLHKRVIELKRQFENAKAEKQDAADKCGKLQKDIDSIAQSISTIEREIAENRQIYDLKQKEVLDLRKQCDQKDSERNEIELKKREIQDQYAEIRKDSDSIKTSINEAQDVIDKIRRESELIRKQIDECTREENSRLKKKEGEMNKQVKNDTLLQMYKNQTNNIECEVSIIKSHLQDTQKKIFSIEKDRERYSEELSLATSQYLHAQDILKDIENKVNQKNKEIIDADRKIHQQQSLYEQVRGEREIASKKVKEVRAEIEHLDHEFARMKNAIDQHKDDIRHKEEEKLRHKNDLERVLREEQNLREKLTEVQIKMATSQRAIASHEGEISKLEKAIKDAEAQLGIEYQKLQEVKRERDHMSNMNVKREIEIRDIGKKLEILKNQCRRGERDYDIKEQDISRIRNQIEKDRMKLESLSQLDIQLKEKRDDVHHLQKELLQLKAERAAMEEELSIPINIHRWTLLESSDPLRFEKLKRYQELQTELVERTKQVTDLQEQIKEEESKYQELCTQLRRKPGIEVEQTVNEYKNQCKSEKYSLEQITAQLEVYRDAAKEYRKELSDAQTELLSQRNKWIKQKKRDIKNRKDLMEQKAILEELGLKTNLE